MASKTEVELFLSEFMQKMEIFDIIFRDDRKKNTGALLKLEFTPAKRKEIIRTITVMDYSEGPLDDMLSGIASLWVFGKTIKANEIYIKISMGWPNSNVICISFHEAEHKMNYPFKK